MDYKRFAKFSLLFVALSALLSCTTVGGLLKLDTDLKLTFNVDADINPDDKKTPSPLFVRMYELKSTKMFEKANFIDLFEKDKEVLGADMLAVHRLKRLKPGENAEVKFVLDSKTQFVGLVAEFLQYKNATYKLIIPVTQHNVVTSSAVIRVSGNTISLVK